jgi:homoserine dehydrogenase
MQVDFEDIYTEGITKITDVDLSYAREMGATIKLLGTGKKVGNKVYAMISPVLLNSDNPLYSVNDVFNAIFVRGNLLGDVMFYGAGAGKFPTASAVVSDVVDAVKHLGTNIMTIWSSEKLKLADKKDASRRFFVRVPAAEEEKARQIFGDIQEVDAGILGDFGFITPVLTEGEYEEKAKSLTVRSRIRMDF